MAWLWVTPRCQEGELSLKKWTAQKESGRPDTEPGRKLLEKGRKWEVATQKPFKMHTFRGEWSGDDYKGVKDYCIGVRKSRPIFRLSDDDLVSYFVENIGATRKQFPHISAPKSTTHMHLHSFLSLLIHGMNYSSSIWSLHLRARGHCFSLTLGLGSCHLPLFFSVSFFGSL